MTDTETPIEAGARALHELPTFVPHGAYHDGCEMFAHVVFGSVGVEGLAEVMGAHWLRRPTAKLAYLRAVTVTRECACGHTLRPQYFEWRHYEEHNAHVAGQIKRWLTGGGA